MISEVEAKSTLEYLYSALTGVEFRAKYDGRATLPSTGNQRDVLLVNDVHMTGKLDLIFDNLQKTQVQLKTGDIKPLFEVVWKGITRALGNAYKLWVEPLQDKPALDSRFRVKQCEVFKQAFAYFTGVSIVVEEIKDSLSP